MFTNKFNAMNLLSKIILLLLAGLVGAEVFLYIKLDKSYKAQCVMHAALIDKIEEAKNTHANMENIPNVQPAGSTQKLYGLDISHWDGDIVQDIPKIDHISFLICKATQGDGGIDPDFKKNWALIRQKGILRGAYHFYMYADDPVKQAIHFCNTVGTLARTDISMILDIEELSLPRNAVDKEKLQNDVTTFLNEVERRTKRRPIIYADYAFANEYLDNSTYAAYPLWLAEYSKGSSPQIPHAWEHKGCMIWQKSDKYNVNSIETDFDVFDGVKDELYMN